MKEAILVTLAMGDGKSFYEKNFLPSQKAYAAKYGWDYKVVDTILEPYEATEEGKRKFQKIICMQKALLVKQSWAQEYKYVIYMDADILVNYSKAPSILEGLQDGKIGVVDERCIWGNKANATSVWNRMAPHLPNSAEGWYKHNGFDKGFPTQFNAGVMVFQPQFHKEFCQMVYEKYMPKVCRGEDIDGDQGPFNYEGNIAGNLQFLDERFNRIWILTYFLFYNFLDERYDKEQLQKAVATVFENCYCLHFAGRVGWRLF